MLRAFLLMLEITLWTLGFYLVMCNLAAPPRKTIVQTVNRGVNPAVILDETPRPDIRPQHLAWQLSPPDWREQREMSSGSMLVYVHVLTRVDIPRAVLWTASILGCTCLLAQIPRRLRRRLPFRGQSAFLVLPGPPAPS